MLANSGDRTAIDENAIIAYTRSLHDYTLRLWTESRRLAEERALQKAALKRQQEEERRIAPSTEVQAGAGQRP